MPQNTEKVAYQSVGADEDGQRLDNWLLARLKGVPRSHVYRIIRSGEVRINKGRAKAASRVASGDLIRLPPIRSEQRAARPASAGLQSHLAAAVLYRDADVMVLNKPAGLAVHAGSGVGSGLIDAARELWGEDWQLAHRLDRETSGCLLLARRRERLRDFQQALADGQVCKQYQAIVHGPWPAQLTELRSQLARSATVEGERRVREDSRGKLAVTQVVVARSWENASSLSLRIETGRTHQIRAQTAAQGHPIIGDVKYGRRALDQSLALPAGTGLCLHAEKLELSLGGRLIQAKAPPPPGFLAVLSQLQGSA